MIEYKKNYTQAELTELCDWFAAHLDNLPTTFDLDASTHFPNLPKSIRIIIELLQKGERNPTFSGQIFIFFKLREKLIETGI